MSDALAALTYARARTAARELRTLWRRPTTVLAAAIAVVLARQGGLADNGSTTTFLHDHDQLLDLAVPGALTAVIVLAAAATAGSPLRLTAADLSWLSTVPGGLRALVLGGTLSGTCLAAATGLAWALTATVVSGRPLVAMLSTAGTTTALVASARAVSVTTAVIVADTRRRRAAVALMVSGSAACAGLIAGLALRPSGAAHDVASVARPVVDAFAIGLFRPQPGTTSTLLALALTMLAAAAALAWHGAERLRDGATEMTRAMDELTAGLAGAWSPSAVIGRAVRSGVPTLPAPPSWTGPRAFAYRALCHERRLARRSVGSLVVLALASAAASGLPHHQGASVLALGLILVTANGLAGPMALEIAAGHLVRTPGDRLPQLWWLHTPRLALNALVLAAAWLPGAALSSVPAGTAAAVAVSLPAPALALTAAGCVVALVGGPLVSRIWLSTLLAGAPLVVALTPIAALHQLLEPAAVLIAGMPVCLGFAALYTTFAIALVDARDRRRAA